MTNEDRSRMDNVPIHSTKGSKVISLCLWSSLGCWRGSSRTRRMTGRLDQRCGLRSSWKAPGTHWSTLTYQIYQCFWPSCHSQGIFTSSQTSYIFPITPSNNFWSFEWQKRVISSPGRFLIGYGKFSSYQTQNYDTLLTTLKNIFLIVFLS